MEEYDHMAGMHESYPDIGTGLTEKHGSPSDMHEAGVDRYINKSSMSSDMTTMASAGDDLPNPFMPSKPAKEPKPRKPKPTPLPPNEF